MEKKFADKDVVFLGLTSEGEKKKQKSQEFLEKYKIEWVNGYGAKALIKALGVTGYPTSFVIGKDGTVAWNDELGGSLEEAITKALEE